MEGLEKYKSKLKSLSTLIEKIENGTLSIDELSELEDLTRYLHERSIILKYKAFEKKVGLTKVVEIEEEMEDKVDDNGLEFSLFEEPSSTKEPEEETAEEVIEVEKPNEEVVNETIVEMPAVEEKKIAPNKEVNLSKPIKSDDDQKGNFLERIKTLPNSVSSQFSESKIESLNGAFGLNERLRYIRELFDGSNDLFSEAISSLDSQPSLEDASVKVEELAFSNSWDLEEEAVLEFMSIIKRRYA